jgi:hypothetical protein
MCRPLMRCIETAAKHARPVLKERMAIIDAAEEKDIEPDLPVSFEICQLFLTAADIPRMTC